MPVNRQRAERLRIAALASGCVATLATVVVGCTVVVDGTGEADAEDVPLYRASVSSSIAASESSSAARESARQTTLTVKAIKTACEDLSSTSVDVVRAVNAYVEASNKRPGEVASTKQPAIDALTHSADLVSADITDALPAVLRELLNDWVAAARAAVDGINSGGVDAFNDAITRLNNAKDTALPRCDSAY